MNREELEKKLEEMYLKGFEEGKKSAEREKGEWIPVSERLPEVDEDGFSEWVLVTTKNLDKTVTMYDRLSANSWLTECFEGEKVLAWQPLPEPYKAEKGGK